MTVPALALVTSGALSAVVEIAEGLEIDVERLRANLDMTGGQIMAEAVSFALADKMGRAEAHALVQELSRQAVQEKRPLKEVLLSNLRVKWQLGAAAIEKLFMPLTYQGSAQTFIDRLVVSAQMRAPRRAGAPRGNPAGASGRNPGCSFRRRSARTQRLKSNRRPGRSNPGCRPLLNSRRSPTRTSQRQWSSQRIEPDQLSQGLQPSDRAKD